MIQKIIKKAEENYKQSLCDLDTFEIVSTLVQFAKEAIEALGFYEEESNYSDGVVGAYIRHDDGRLCDCEWEDDNGQLAREFKKKWNKEDEG